MGKAIGAAAAGLGYLVRFLLLIWPPVALLLGFCLVAYSVWLFDHRVAIGFTGLCLFVSAMQIRLGGRH